MREPKCLGVSVRTLGGSDGEKAGGLPHGRPWLCAVAALLCPVALLAPATAGARDLVVYGEPTLEKALKSVGSLWQARTGTRVNVFVAPTDLSYAQIDRGARCDVIFALAGAATEEAARAKIIHAATISRALRNGLVLVGTERGSAPIADASLTDISRLIAGARSAVGYPTVYDVSEVRGGESGIQIGGTYANRRCASPGRQQ